jgi:hypothetical protein
MAGQPTKYKPEYCDELIHHMAQGFSFESFAGKIGVCRDTLYAWRDAHPEFSDSIKRGKDASLYAWEYKLRQSVDDRNINATSVYFALKCRFGYKETTAHEVSGPDGKPIESRSLSNLTDEQLEQKLAAMLSKGKAEAGE